MTTGGAMRIAACLVLASPLPTSGCSFVFVTGAKRQDSGPPVPAGCTTSMTAPTVDAIFSGIEATGTVVALTQAALRGRDAAVGAAIVTTLLLAASAMYGFATVGTCREVTRYTVNPYQQAPAKQTRAERLSDEAAEEAAVQARLKEQQTKEAEEAKAAGAAARTSGDKKQAPPAH